MNKNLLLFLLLLISILIFTNVQAQDRWSVRAGFGTASGTDPVDGFYYSFDVGIPVFRWMEVAPTFNFFSTVPGEWISSSWNKYADRATYIIPEQDRMHYSGDVMGSVSLLLLFKPLAFFNNQKMKKHELAFGGGIGLKSYAMVRYTYEPDGNSYELIEFGAKSARSVEPYFAKVFYNYHFSNRFFAGPVASIDGFDGEAVALFGIQIGINPWVQ